MLPFLVLEDFQQVGFTSRMCLSLSSCFLGDSVAGLFREVLRGTRSPPRRGLADEVEIRGVHLLSQITPESRRKKGDSKRMAQKKCHEKRVHVWV